MPVASQLFHVCPHCGEALDKEGERIVQKEAQNYAAALAARTTYEEEDFFLRHALKIMMGVALGPFVLGLLVSLIALPITETGHVGKQAMIVLGGGMLWAFASQFLLLKVVLKRRKSREVAFVKDHPNEAAILNSR